MEIKIDIKPELIGALEIIRKHTGMELNDVICRSIVTGLQTLDSQIRFAKAREANQKAGIQVSEEAQ